VKSDCRGDYEPEGLAVAEGGADADALGRRVHGHDTDDEHGFASVGASQRAQGEVVAAADQARGEMDEGRTAERSEHRAVDVPRDALDQQAGAGCEHDARGEGVGRPEPVGAPAAPDGERKCTEPGGERCRQCGRENESRVRHRGVSRRSQDLRAAGPSGSYRLFIGAFAEAF
jgi:hypothetical protein